MAVPERLSQCLSSGDSGEFFVKETIEDIRQHAIKSRGYYDNIVRNDTVFFQLVRGGNVGLVTQVLEYMKENRLRDEMIWAVGESRASVYRNSIAQRKLMWRLWKHVRRALRVLLFLVLWGAMTLLSPVFYALHAFSCVTISRLCGRISKRPDLPLLFAVLSENADMVRLFLQYGISPRCTDRHGNTVYHYLADISAEDPDKFKRCHQLMKEVLCEKKNSVLSDIIIDKENDMGLSPLEMLVFKGSIAVVVHLTREECFLGKLYMAVSSKQVTTQSVDDRDTYITYTNLTEQHQALRRHKSISFKHVGGKTPFHGRNPMFMPKKTDHKFNLTRWEFDITKYEQKDIYGKQSLLLSLLTARSVQSMKHEDVSALMTSRLLRAWISLKSRVMVCGLLLIHATHVIITGCLLGTMVTEGGDMNRYPLFPKCLTELLELLHNAEEGGDTMVSLRRPFSNVRNISCYNWYGFIKGVNLTGCMYAALEEVNINCELDTESLVQSTGLNRDQLGFQVGKQCYNTLYTIMCLIILHLVVDFLQKTIFLVRHWFGRKSIQAGILSVIGRRMPGSYTDKVLNFVMYSLFLYYLKKSADFDEIRKSVEEGEYLLYTVVQDSNMSHSVLKMWQEYAQEGSAIAEIESRILVVCLIIRFILIMHSLRLLPHVGFFIITSKKMGIHLLEFGIVYGLVTAIFSAIFHFIMRDGDCPAKKVLGFESIWSSLFVVYTLSLGGDADNIFVESGNANAKIAFAVYTLISVLLLLNLIIAVMTTTVDELNRRPWKEALCVMELWDEILGAEAIILTLATPVITAIQVAKTLLHPKVHPRLAEQKKRRVLIPVTYTLE